MCNCNFGNFTECVLGWRYFTTDQTPEEYGYTVTVCENQAMTQNCSTMVPTTLNTTLFTGLTPGVSYWFYVT